MSVKYKGTLTNARSINIESNNLVRFVQNDKDVNIIDFELYKDNVLPDIDFSKANITINYSNVDTDTDESVSDIYMIDTVKSTDSTITFSWVVGSNASVYAGMCYFQIIITITDENDKIIQQWESVINQIPVFKSLENVNITQPKDFVDLVSQLKKYVSDIKKWFAQVITEMGVQTAPDDSFEKMIQNILKISSGGYGVSGYVDTTIYTNGILFSLYGISKEVE